MLIFVPTNRSFRAHLTLPVGRVVGLVFSSDVQSRVWSLLRRVYSGVKMLKTWENTTQNLIRLFDSDFSDAISTLSVSSKRPLTPECAGRIRILQSKVCFKQGTVSGV